MKPYLVLPRSGGIDYHDVYCDEELLVRHLASISAHYLYNKRQTHPTRALLFKQNHGDGLDHLGNTTRFTVIPCCLVQYYNFLVLHGIQNTNFLMIWYSIFTCCHVIKRYLIYFLLLYCFALMCVMIQIFQQTSPIYDLDLMDRMES